MISSTFFAFVLLFVAGIDAHISIVFPPPFRAPTNPLATNKNYDINSPISAAQFPCSGDHKTGGPSAATLTAGSESKITFSGGAEHGGGSCQVSLSYDQNTFTVIHSWMGGCPTAGGTLPFTVPADAPAGPATFAWSWNNRIGNREFYMNCGAVTIVAGSKRQTPAVAFKDRPDIFVANLGNGCTTPEGTDPIYPNPGPDVTGKGTGSPITGCQPVNGIGNSQRGGGSAPAPAPAPSASKTASSSVPVATQPAVSSSPAAFPVFSGSPVVSVPADSGAPVTSSNARLPVASPSSTPSDSLVIIPITSSTTSASAPTGTGSGTAPSSAPGNLAESQDGTCGSAKNLKCRTGFCCSAANFCGSSSLHCGSGCQSGFGQCGTISRRGAPYNSYHRHQYHAGVAGRVRV